MNIMYIFLIIVCLIDLFISFKKFNKPVNIIVKTVALASMVLITILGKLSYNISSCIILLTSICNLYLLKDKDEEYFVPFKALAFMYSGLSFLNLSVLNTNLTIFICNIVLLLLYLSTKNKVVKYIYGLVILGLDIYTMIFMTYKLIPSIFNLIMYFIGFYILYIGGINKKLLDVVYILLTIYIFVYMFLMLSRDYIIAVFVMYAIFIAITRKDKVVFITSLITYLLSTMYYFLWTIDDRNIVYILSIIMTFICAIVFYKIILKKYHE